MDLAVLLEFVEAMLEVPAGLRDVEELPDVLAVVERVELRPDGKRIVCSGRQSVESKGKPVETEFLACMWIELEQGL